MIPNNATIQDKPLVGFFPVFYSIGETIPHVKIARLYIEEGGKAIFFSHGGRYEYLADELGCEVIRLQSPWKELVKKAQKMMKRNVPFEKIMLKKYTKDNIGTLVEEEIEAFKITKVKYIVSSYNPVCSVSARALHIPLIILISGTCLPLYFKSGHVTFPENYENFLIRLLPPSIKDSIAKWYLLNNNLLVSKFNKVAKRYQIKPFKLNSDFYVGDITFVCDDINFLGIEPTKEFEEKNFVGPIAEDLFKDTKKDLDVDIKNHLNRKGKSILFMMGSLSEKKLFLKILETLNQTNYNVIAIYTTILKKTELPKTNDNILLKQFLHSPKAVNELVDIAIIHGGRGTVYTAAYSGKPVIGIPIIMEHQYNIDNLVRNGAGIRISKKFFTPNELLDAIDNIFANYDRYLANAQKLAAKLTKEPGEKKANQRLIETIQSTTNIR